MLNKFKKEGLTEIGTDKAQLFSPIFQIINVNFNKETQNVEAEIMHEVEQGAIIQKHSRTETIPLLSLDMADIEAGTKFLDAVQAKIVNLQQYAGSIKLD